LREGYGSDRRLSRTLGQIQLYVAVRAGPGVLRASTALSQVDRIVGGRGRSLTSAAVLALLVAAVVSLLASRHLTRPIAAITEAARAIASGEPPHLPHSNIPDIDALIRAIRDMHEQLERRFEELRTERGEGAALVEAMIEGVIAADARGRIVTANAAARRLLGYGPSDPLPNLDQVFRPKPARVAVQEVLAGESVTERQVELDAATVLLSGRSLPGDGTLLVLHDVTALRRLETVRRDFVANVSHELKTPLTSISGYAETLSQELPDSDTTRRFLGVILGNARRMQRLVDGLLDLSRIESGGWRPAPERLDTAAVAQETWHLVKDRLGTRPAELVTEIANGAETIWSDPDAYRQVLTNLLENALRYTPPGGRIWLRARPEDQGVLVSVRDEGPGIAGEHLPRIFERFYRADAGRSREEGGTGLGLAIVRHLVDAHGGWVHAESALGSGSEFSCWFPAPKRDPDEVLMPA
jgi:signal transduction histidine kinase